VPASGKIAVSDFLIPCRKPEIVSLTIFLKTGVSNKSDHYIVVVSAEKGWIFLKVEVSA
jgi:hypothetical protein